MAIAEPNRLACANRRTITAGDNKKSAAPQQQSSEIRLITYRERITRRDLVAPYQSGQIAERIRIACLSDGRYPHHRVQAYICLLGSDSRACVVFGAYTGYNSLNFSTISKIRTSWTLS